MTIYTFNSTGAPPKLNPANLVGSFQPILTASIGLPLKFPVSGSTSRNIIEIVTITDTSGSDNLSPKTIEDELDRQIAAMTDEERLAAIRAMAGTWTDFGEETNQGWRFYDWDAPDGSEQIPV